jgi:hypothetical protein
VRKTLIASKRGTGLRVQNAMQNLEILDVPREEIKT